MDKRKIIVVGENFLHRHPTMEGKFDLIIKEHVIVDREDWEAICEFFNDADYPHRTGILSKSLHKEALAGDPAPEQNAGTACEGPKNLVKPPLGIMPRKLWLEIRLKELSEAMYRYISVGSLIPEEWAQEYNQLLSELQK